jgi:hypothetical protein
MDVYTLGLADHAPGTQKKKLGEIKKPVISNN